MISIKLFSIFFKLGFFSFGGGYSMIPLIEQAFTSNNINMTSEAFANISAIAGIAPGPVGVNLAIGFGHELGGFLGAVSSVLGVLLPSLILVSIVAVVFNKVYKSNYFKWALDGLKPIIVGIIMYAGISMAMKNGIMFSNPEAITSSNGNLLIYGKNYNIYSIAIMVTAFYALLKTKIPPVLLIFIGGITGIFIF